MTRLPEADHCSSWGGHVSKPASAAQPRLAVDGVAIAASDGYREVRAAIAPANRAIG